MRRLALVLFLLHAAPAAADEGITLPARIASTPRVDSVGIAADGIVYGSAGGQVMVFGTNGETLKTWAAYGPMAAAPGGEVYTLYGAVTRWSWDGRVLAQWGAFQPFDQLSVAPDGTVLVGGGRYSPVGELLGRLPADGWPASAGGRTWITQATAVAGYDDRGRRIAYLGNVCPIGGPGPVCGEHFGHPEIAATPDGGVLVADLVDSRLEGYDRDGSLRFTCTRAIGIDDLASIAALGDDVILGGSHGIYRAKLTADGWSACRSPRLVTHVRVRRRGDSLRISFALERRADVRIRAGRTVTVQNLAAGRHTVRLRARGPGLVTVADAPPVSFPPRR